MLAIGHHFLDLCDRLAWIEIFWTSFGAIENRVAAIQPKGIFEGIETITRGLIPTIDDPSIGLQQRCRTQVPI